MESARLADPTLLPPSHPPQYITFATASSATGLKGVTVTTSGKYQARIKIDGRKRDLGTYKSQEEAAAAYFAAKSSGIVHKPSPQRQRAKPERVRAHLPRFATVVQGQPRAE